MIGKMKHRLTLQEPIRTPDGAGGFTVVWRDIAEHPGLYARIQALSGRETLKFGQLETKVTHRIAFRHRKDVRPGMRFIGAAEAYSIVSVADPDGTGVYAEALAELITL